MIAGSVPLPAPEPRSANPGFLRVQPGESGITFQHVIPSARHLTNQMLLDGSGVALGDVDGDGKLDIFLAATTGGSQLWRNDGAWHFHDITATSFPSRTALLSGDVTGAAFADLNGDGHPDLVLNTHADGVRVLLNDGRGVFQVLPFQQSSARGGHSLALADVDGDGWVDLYVCNYRERALMDMPSARATFSGVGLNRRVATLDGRPTTAPDLTNRFVVNAAGGLDEMGEVDVLYRNVRGTNFVEIPWVGGAFLDEDGTPLSEPPRDWGLAAQFCDVNGDGRPDLYVCNDFQTPDRFWINEGTPGSVRFRLVGRSVVRHTSLFSMGVDFGDINRDGRPDFVVVDMLSPDPVRRLTMLDGTPTVPVNAQDPLSRPQSDANTMFLQRADGSFSEVAAFAGVTATDWSWTPAFVDVDLDGWLDLLVSAGQERGSRDLDVAEHMKVFRKAGLRTDAQIFRERQKFPRLPARLQAYRNLGPRGNGAVPVFDDVGNSWGLDTLGVSHGMALGDLDGDGDADLVVNFLNDPVGLYRNTAPGPRLEVSLTGRPPNTGAVGACLRFGWGADPVVAFREYPQSAQITAGGRYLSSDGPTRTFACPGEGTGLLEIRWPSGTVSTLRGLAANQRVEVAEPAGPSEGVAVEIPKTPPRLRFDSRPTEVLSAPSLEDDFAVQPLLPRRQITRTPVLAWAEEGKVGGKLWIGGASGQSVREIALVSGQVSGVRDVGPAGPTDALLTVNGTLLLAAPPAQGPATVVLDLRWIRGDGSPAGNLSMASNLVPASMAAIHSASGTNSWVFLGGGPLPGRYPGSSPSGFFRIASGRFVSGSTTNLGIVGAAASGDLDGDGMDELVTAGEWTSPRVWKASGEGWASTEVPLEFPGGRTGRLSDLSGWWQSVALDDVDGDGRPDVILGNWGLNSAYGLFSGRPRDIGGPTRPLSIFYEGEADSSSGVCLLAYESADGRILPVQGRAELAPRIPWLAERFPTYRSFAMASVPEILGDRMGTFQKRECRWMSSLLLLNRGDRFVVRELPAEAQLGPIFSLAAGDFDGDGRRDLYAAQGFFGNNFGIPRDDAGEGVFLMGNGDGTFEAIPVAATGVRILGEQRSVLAGDVDGDGRTDLVLGIHGGPMTLLLNRDPKSGAN
ncbi:MAG: VCBS repeat-containing protein [Verrucomicrobiota bacterium]